MGASFSLFRLLVHRVEQTSRPTSGLKQSHAQAFLSSLQVIAELKVTMLGAASANLRPLANSAQCRHAMAAGCTLCIYLEATRLLWHFAQEPLQTKDSKVSFKHLFGIFVMTSVLDTPLQDPLPRWQAAPEHVLPLVVAPQHVAAFRGRFPGPGS